MEEDFEENKDSISDTFVSSQRISFSTNSFKTIKKGSLNVKILALTIQSAYTSQMPDTDYLSRKMMKWKLRTMKLIFSITS